jgi:hypothetical protein
MPDDAKARKEELLRLITDAEPAAKEVEAIGRRMAASARFAQDMSGSLAETIREIPLDQLLPEDLNRQIESWRAWQRSAVQVRSMGSTVELFEGATSSSVNSCVITVMGVYGGSSPIVRPPVSVQAAIGKVFRNLRRSDQAKRATDSMRRLGLDTRGGAARAPLDLLQEARGAIERPTLRDGGPVSVLITLRECIDAVITELVRRRIDQAPAKGWSGKVLSVGGQCARAPFDVHHFERLATDAESLMKQLSGAKQTDLDRECLARYFDEGMLFLNALMDSVDEGKLRPNK